MNKIKRILISAVTALVAAASSLVAVSCDQFTGLFPQVGGHTHNLTKVAKVEATCIEAGQEAYYTCDGCEEIFADINGTTVIEAPKAIAALGHRMTGVAGVEATCTEAGTADHYRCTRCDVLFSDSKGENVITEAPVVGTLEHALIKTEAVAATCTQDGNNAYWTCSTCKKVYADAEAKTETTVAEQAIKAQGHSLTKTNEKPATCTEAGNIAYWTCGTCDKIYADEDCKNEIELADTVVAVQGHDYNATLVVEGAVTTYEPGERFNTNLVVKLDCKNCEHYETVIDYEISKTENLQPEDTAIVISYTKEGKIYTATVNITVVHVHTTGDLVPATEATCTEEGTLAYYECSVCKVKFEDKEATKALETIVVSAKGHDGKKTDAVASSCTEAGNNAYWTCEVCEKVFADEACTQETTVEEQKLPLADHETEVAKDDEGHWYECANCDYASEKESHVGVPYPDAAAICTICNATFAEASWEGWVLYRPAVKPSGDLIKSATHVEVDGIMASQYVFNAKAAGAESATWPNDEKGDYNNGQYQVRIPTVGDNARALYVYVTNNSDVAVSFRMYSENYGDKGGVDIALGANESGIYKYTVKTGTTVGANVNFKLLSDLASEATITVYGYFYLAEAEIANLKAANQDALKLSYEVGETFDISNMILSANVATDAEGDLLDLGGTVETYYIKNNYTIEGLTNGYEFASEDVGTHTVAVSFGGKSFTLTVSVSSHEHNPELVAKKSATCTEAGYEAYYECNVNGCGQKFADAEGKTPISSPTVIPAGHLTGTALPGEKAICPRCGLETGEVRDAAGWMHFVPSKYTSIVATNDTVNGMMATVYTIPAGTAANTKYNFETHNEDTASKEGKYQVRIPLQGERKILVYLENLSDVDATVKFGDDTFNLGNTTVTLLANSYATAEFVLNGNTIGPWMGMQLLSDVPADKDLKIAIFGYMYVEEAEANLADLKVIQNATTLAFKPGSTFSAEGLILGASHITSLYIRTGYTTDLDGHVFTATESGKKTVTVSFAGLTTTYEIEVLDHAHELEEVAGKAVVKCQEDGYETYWKCTIVGCNKMFSDLDGSHEIVAPVAIPAHNGTALPGAKAICVDCGKEFGEVRDGTNWVLFTLPTDCDKASDGSSATYADVNGVAGTKFTFGADTGVDSAFTLHMNNNHDGKQTVIPNVASLEKFTSRKIVTYYYNYGTEDITLRLWNDANKGEDNVTIPAGKFVVSEFEVTYEGGSNWFKLFVKNDVTTDVTVGFYGYLYFADAEITGISVATPATKLSFAEGDKFTTEGLVLKMSGATKEVLLKAGYTTDLEEGYVFTDDDVKAGKKTITVTFGGQTTTYEVAVSAHAHQLNKVEKAAVECVSDGVKAYWECTADGCDAIFSDENGSKQIAAPIAISCHENIGMPGTTAICSKCSKEYTVSMYGWVFYNMTTQKGSCSVVNGNLEAAEVEGMPGTKIFIGAGTTAGSSIQLCMGDNDANKQTVIPNLGSNAASGDVRNVVLFYKNYSDQDITLNLQNDAGGGNGSVTVPANGTAICEFAVKNVGGSNWFYLYVDSDVTEDAVVGVYGYLYVNENEVSEMTVRTPATKLTYKVGETFSAAGLVFNAPIPSSNTKTLYVTTGYVTNYDGYTFTADDIGEQTVLVTFAGVTVEYTITVTA